MITIQKMTKEQVNETRKLVEETLHKKAQKKEIDTNSSFSFVAVEENIIKGHILVHIHEDVLLNEKSLYLSDVVVREEDQGKGIGTQLLTAVFQYAKENGFSKIELTSRASRIAAHHLYQKCGFTIRDTSVFQKKIS